MMGEVSFVPGKIANSKVDATGMKLIDVEVPEDIAQGYSTPGQYLQLKVGDEKPGFYAVCSPPDKRNILTFLVKETDGSKAFTSLSAGGTCELSATMGSGFKTADNFDGYRYDFPTMYVHRSLHVTLASRRGRCILRFYLHIYIEYLSNPPTHLEPSSSPLYQPSLSSSFLPSYRCVCTSVYLGVCSCSPAARD
jgi:hypothetical protein